jgi:hypothetical protein
MQNAKLKMTNVIPSERSDEESLGRDLRSLVSLGTGFCILHFAFCIQTAVIVFPFVKS